MLLGSIAHATGFAIVGTLFYLALRRWSPAAGALAAGSSIVIMALGLVDRPGALASLVDRRTAGIGTSDGRPALPDRGRPIERCTFERPRDRPRNRSMAPRERAHRVFASSRPERSLVRPTSLGELNRELGDPRPSPERPRWGWPEWLAVGFLASLCLGLARLGLGSWRSGVCERGAGRSSTAISTTRSRSCGLSCRCTRKVEVRETTELATPATIGWRRPLCSCRATGANGITTNAARCWPTSWRTCAAATSWRC